MAAGRPAIAAIDRGSETWELLQQAQAGISVEPEDPKALAQAVLDFYQNNDARRRAGENGRKCAERDFDPATLSERYLGLLRHASGLDPGARQSVPSTNTSNDDKALLS